jgi:DNA-directed RNA polymerase sigma subunit (sigma70/sigma32)
MNIVEDNDLDNAVLCDEVLSIAKSVLSEKEFDILLDYTLTSITFKALGGDYGVSGERIKQIYDKSIRKLKGSLSYTKMVYNRHTGRYNEVNKNILFDREFI